jgi:suppressor for copper-sensitivity B
MGTAARSEDAAMSNWSHGTHSAMRLIAGATAPSGKQRIGVELKLSPGYKTYWRNPGTAGLPPRFDWSGSENVGGLDVRWPTPMRFRGGASVSIGYAGEVVIPVSVLPVDASKPVMVVLTLDYAVCEKICVPARGEAQLWLEPGVTTVSSPRLEEYEARVPLRIKLGEAPERLAILDVKALERGDALEVLLRAPAGGAVDDVFVEGPGSWSFGRPELTPQADGSVLARIAVEDRPKGAAGPRPFIVTLRGRPAPVEGRLDLDIPNLRP